MNYFDLYEIRPAFLLDEGLIKKKFLLLSRQYHPDRFVLSPEIEKEEAEALASANNKAYHILSDFTLRLKYILTTYYQLDEEATQSLNQTFLMSMLDLHDLIDEDPEKARLHMHELKAEWYQDIQPDLVGFDADQVDNTSMDRLREYYFKLKYIKRLEKNLEGKVEM